MAMCEKCYGILLCMVDCFHQTRTFLHTFYNFHFLLFPHLFMQLCCCQGQKNHENKSQRKTLSLTPKQKKDMIMWFKNKNIRTKNKNTRCAKQTWKWLFIMLIYANMNMKKTWQGYDAKLCFRLFLNRLKEMKGPTPIYTPFRT
jgi:hypothetical protein